VRVALTFDAEHPSRSQCPTGVQEQIVDILAERGVQATFFLQGRWATAYPTLARRIAEQGHLIGSHSHWHARLPLLTDDGLRQDLAAAERAIAETAGVSPRPWFRAPYGDVDERVLAVVEELGYRHVGWDVIAPDWETERTAAEIEAAVLEGAKDGDVVVLHTWPSQTAAALPRILDRLDGVLTLDQLS
jgi:peptidoglycan/xylan/chitin deacetylase (PgdA/CDA1 family)